MEGSFAMQFVQKKRNEDVVLLYLSEYSEVY